MTDGTPISGLWAYSAGKFYVRSLVRGDRKTDHTSWFREIGLPDYGHAYDRILRGRLVWNDHYEHYLLTFYGIDALPNRIYDLVIRHFDTGEKRIVERRVSESWNNF